MIRPSLAVLLLLAACSSNPSGNFVPNPQGVDRSPRLSQVTSCNQLETAIEDALVLEMKSTLEQIRKSDIYIARGGGPVPASGPLAAGGAASGPTNYTTTNSQVAGVDEADFVQNDGTRIAVLADGKLHLLSSWPAESMVEKSSLGIEGWPRDMFLAGNQVVVFSGVYVPRPLEGAYPICLAAGPYCGYFWSDLTQITTVDVSDLAHPQIVAKIILPGTYQSARKINDRVRLVLSDSFPFPEGVRYWPDLPPGATTDQRNKAFDGLEAANEAQIRGRSLEDWLRTGSITKGATTTPIPYSASGTCSEYSVSTAPSRPGLLTVATVDLGSDTLKSRNSVLAEPGTVYASEKTLYVATSHWWWWPAVGQSDATYIHAFDLTDPDSAPYIGSGAVDGTIGSSDQYAMDEFQGSLRVATQLATRVDDGTPWGTLKTANRISVLTLGTNGLTLAGKTDDYGPGEQTYGTRFVGTRGFVITAHQVDPLFTFDLADPAHPRKVGELQMPGFISYLHPIDDTHLLGVGRQANTATSTTQLKIALLDVTDLSAPSTLAVQLVGEGWSYSDALWDPKAFTWLGATSTLAIPFADYGGANFASDLRLFKVEPATGITSLGSLSMSDVFTVVNGPGWSWSWSPWIRRSILADGYVYAISDAGVRAAVVANLPAWVSTVKFAPLTP